MNTSIWRLIGLSGSEFGQLQLMDARLIYAPNDKIKVGFNVPLAEVTDINFPWHYFGGGFKMRIGGEQFRFSFIEPHNENADISEARALGKKWKEALTKR